MSESLHPSAPHDLPSFITAPGDTDILMVVIGIVLLGSVLMVGNFYLQLHSLPERMAHKSQKLQFEIVAVLGLLALFTHNHLFWVIGLLLAMVDLPDFGTPLRRIAGSVDKIAGAPPGGEPVEALRDWAVWPESAERRGDGSLLVRTAASARASEQGTTVTVEAVVQRLPVGLPAGARMPEHRITSIDVVDEQE